MTHYSYLILLVISPATFFGDQADAALVTLAVTTSHVLKHGFDQASGIPSEHGPRQTASSSGQMPHRKAIEFTKEARLTSSPTQTHLLNLSMRDSQ